MSVNTNSSNSQRPAVVFAGSQQDRVRTKPSSHDGQHFTPDSAEFSLICEFEELSRSSSSLDELLSRIATSISQQLETLGMWVSQQDEEGRFSKVHSMFDAMDKVLWETIAPLAGPLLVTAVESSKIQATLIPHSPKHQIVVAPVLEGPKIKTVFGGCFDTSNTTAIRQQWLIGIASQTIGNWLQRQETSQSEQRFKGLSDVFAVTSQLDTAQDFDSLSLTLVNQVKRVARCEQVAFCFLPNAGRPKLLAVSDLDSVDTVSEASAIMLAAAHQSIVAGKLLAFPDASATMNSSDLLPLESFASVNGTGACISTPLTTSEGDCLGSLLMTVSEETASCVDFQQYLERFSATLSNHLAVVFKANRSLAEIASSEFRRFVTGRITKIIAFATVLFAVAMMIPMSYRIQCDSEVQPVLRRFIAAPHNGILAKTLVKNGEIVSVHQVLAEMDGRQLRIERASIDAEHKGARKKQSAAQAEGDYSQAQIAASDVARLQAQLDLLDEKLVNLLVRSPIKGMVVAGDLEKSEGAPLKMGQTLFEIAPLDSMLAEIAIAENEIPYVRKGMPVDIKLNAFPFKTWHGTVETIHARAELLDSESVFIAEVRLDNSTLKLKPGMKGSAKIQSDAYPIGWNYFHRAAECVRYWTIW